MYWKPPGARKGGEDCGEGEGARGAADYQVFISIQPALESISFGLAKPFEDPSWPNPQPEDMDPAGVARRPMKGSKCHHSTYMGPKVRILQGPYQKGY